MLSKIMSVRAVLAAYCCYKCCVRAPCEQEIILLSEMEAKKEAAEGVRTDRKSLSDWFQTEKDRVAAAAYIKTIKKPQKTNNRTEQGCNCTFALCDYSDRGSTDLSCGTANQYSCFLPCCAYCCMEALALETKVFFMGFPTRRHRNL